MKLLTKIAEVIFGKKITSLETLPHVALNGFNNLREAFGTSKLFYDETKGMIQCICLLDSDYYPRDMIKKRCDEASANHLKLHIWKRKEIENYLLEPEVLFRISKQSQEKYDVFMKELEEVADEFRNRVFDQYAEHILK